MTLETNPVILAAYSDEQWDDLLDRLYAEPASRPPGLVRIHEVERSPKFLIGEDRRAYIMKRMAEGAKLREVADELGCHMTLVSKIKNGHR